MIAPQKLLFGATIAVLLLSGCTSKVTESAQYSGYLPNYDNLEEAETPSGGTAKRWVSPSWNPNTYDTVMFSKLEFYPTPKPDERVSLQTLTDLQNYMTNMATATLNQKYIVISDANSASTGSKILILRAAITGVTASNEGIKWYEVVPIAALVGATKAAIGYRDQNTNLFVEAELIDGQTYQSVTKVVRKVFGSQVANAKQAITPQDFKIAIDKLNSDLSAFIHN